MKQLIPYLFFNGTASHAMKFYQQCFGGNLELHTYGDAPPEKKADPQLKGAAANEVMHATLTDGKFTLMASDWPNKRANQGDNIQLSIDGNSIEEIEKLFKSLGANGKVVMPLADTFWGAHFGMLIDQFGIHWMLSCEL